MKRKRLSLIKQSAACPFEPNASLWFTWCTSWYLSQEYQRAQIDEIVTPPQTYPIRRQFAVEVWFQKCIALDQIRYHQSLTSLTRVRTNFTNFLPTITVIKNHRSSPRSLSSQWIAISLNPHYYWRTGPIRRPTGNGLRQYDDFSRQDALDTD